MPDAQPRPKATRKKPFASTKQNKDVADRLWSKVIRARGRCELQPVYGTPCQGELEAAHIIPRRWSATRTNPDNGICACGFHHRSCFDAFPGDQGRIVDDLYGDGTYELLRAVAQDGIEALGCTPLQFWREERAWLTREVERLEAADG